MKKSQRQTILRLILSLNLMVLLIPSLVLGDSMFSPQQNYIDLSSPPSWTEGFTLILLDCQDIDQANQARDFIEENGGHIAVLIPPQGMLGWISRDLHDNLVGKHGITGIYTEPVSYGTLSRSDENVNALIDYFNYVTTGELEQEYYTLRTRGAPLVEDSLLNREWHVEKSREQIKKKMDAGEINRSAPQPEYVFGSGNSDIMKGTVACSIFFVESNGSIDANQYSWSSSAVTHTRNQCLTALTWWADKAKNRGLQLSFTLFYYLPGNKNSKQGYEPITHASTEDNLWINAIMSNLNYSAGSKFTRVDAFNSAQKAKAKTDWAYTAFYVYNPVGAPSRFTNNYFAYAYLGGPYTQLCYRNNGWSINDTWRVLAHETGHIFWACDEYYQAGYGGCTSCAPCNTFRPEANNNCEHPSCNPTGSVNCIMKNNTNSICKYTARQIGWNLTNKSLKITASGGGTTNPAPGTYQHLAGTNVTIEAIPSSYYRFRQWGGAATGNENPITIVMSENKNIRANFQKIHSPSNFTGSQVLNRSLSQAEHINVLTWEDNPDNSDITVEKYELYLDENGTRTLLAEFTTGPYQYLHRGVDSEESATYVVVAVNDEGISGEPAVITIQ